jgi:mRNA interferase RelE/StbE
LETERGGENRALPKPIVTRLIALAEDLSQDPFPHGCRKLIGSDHTYRIKSGDYRLVYSVEQSRLVVEIVRARHRKDAYR